MNLPFESPGRRFRMRVVPRAGVERGRPGQAVGVITLA